MIFLLSPFLIVVYLIAGCERGYEMKKEEIQWEFPLFSGVR